jgi:hypothetical protein
MQHSYRGRIEVLHLFPSNLTISVLLWWHFTTLCLYKVIRHFEIVPGWGNIINIDSELKSRKEKGVYNNNNNNNNNNNLFFISMLTQRPKEQLHSTEHEGNYGT